MIIRWFEEFGAGSVALSCERSAVVALVRIGDVTRILLQGGHFVDARISEDTHYRMHRELGLDVK